MSRERIGAPSIHDPANPKQASISNSTASGADALYWGESVVATRATARATAAELKRRRWFKLVASVAALDVKMFFYLPVTRVLKPEQLPGYDAVVPNRLDWYTIQANVVVGHYAHDSDVVDDIVDVLSNSLLYNGIDNTCATEARRIYSEMGKVLSGHGVAASQRSLQTVPSPPVFDAAQIATQCNLLRRVVSSDNWGVLRMVDAPANAVGLTGVKRASSPEWPLKLFNDIATGTFASVAELHRELDGRCVDAASMWAGDRKAKALALRRELPGLVAATLEAAGASQPAVPCLTHAAPTPNRTSDAATQALTNVLRRVLDGLEAADTERVFLYPPLLGEYVDRVAQPVDLLTMRLKLDRGQYALKAAVGGVAGASDFVSDLDAVVDNCITFNGPQHELARAATKLRAQFPVLFRQCSEADATA